MGAWQGMTTRAILTPNKPDSGVKNMERPDVNGRFGKFGGRYVPETLIYALDELTEAYLQAKEDVEFQAKLNGILKDYVGRESPLYFAERLSESLGNGVEVYLKREDLNHTGAKSRRTGTRLGGFIEVVFWHM